MNSVLPSRLLAAIGVTAVLVALPLAVPVYVRMVFALLFVKTILCLSLRQTLLTGLLNLSLVAFMAIGAYFTAFLTTTLEWSYWLVLPLAGIVCGGLGAFASFPLLRLKGAYFFIGTVCIAAVVETFFSNFLIEPLGGVPGFSPVDKPRIAAFGRTYVFASHLSWYYLTLAVLAAATFVFYRLEHSRYGQYWKAMSFSDRLVETVGVGLFRYKMLNVSLASFFAGIAGALFAPLVGLITPHDFNLGFMFLLVLYTVVGGTESFWGPAVGVLVVGLFAEVLREFGQFETLGYGVILVLALRLLPRGLTGFAATLGSRLALERSRTATAPGLTGATEKEPS
jgi:branched-chain amino acid transport system permease protein